MIQRIQSLYLFLVVVLGALLCAFAPISYLQFGAAELIKLTTFTYWPLAVITIAIPLLALVNIFLFKKRILQARINVINVFLCLGYYAILAWFVFYLKKTADVEKFYVGVWACVPLVQLVLSLMATRRILKDEALVRAADRIR